jgi:tRNA (cmo5U34)-methyltransferase
MCFEGVSAASVLDLGCGTGLELNRLFRRFPDAAVTGIDLSAGMLERMMGKYPTQSIDVIQASYFDVNLGTARYDHALSTYSLHHFSAEEKGRLYAKIYDSIRPGGLFVWGDYTAQTPERQYDLLRENERLRRENGIKDGFYHFDIPFTAHAEIGLLRRAGFNSIKIARQWPNTTILRCKKKAQL